MSASLNRDYGFWSLLRFSLPTIAMMIFMSLYTIVDGIFVARFVGPTALSAVNIAFPLISVSLGVGIMLATGGNAEIARRLGEGKVEEARRGFSLLALTGVTAGAVFALVGLFFAQPLARLLGATDGLLGYATDYLRWMLLFSPFCILQSLFQSFFVTAGRPGLGLGLTVCSGVTNAILDYVFIVPLDLGVTGAAIATGVGYLVTAGAGCLFFLHKREGLFFARPNWDAPMLLRTCGNGSSEMVTNLSGAVITFVFNILMLRFLGEDGVAAITIVLYTQFLLIALYLGFSMGVAPILSFQYGADNRLRLRRIFRNCLTFVACSSVVILAISLACAPWLVGVFSPPGTRVYDLALEGFYLFIPSFLFAGLNIFASAFFTALSDGLTSAIISFARTFGFLLAGLLLLPLVLGVQGVWLAVPLAELLCCGLSVGMLVWRGKKTF